MLVVLRYSTVSYISSKRVLSIESKVLERSKRGTDWINPLGSWWSKGRQQCSARGLCLVPSLSCVPGDVSHFHLFFSRPSLGLSRSSLLLFSLRSPFQSPLSRVSGSFLQRVGYGKTISVLLSQLVRAFVLSCSKHQQQQQCCIYSRQLIHIFKEKYNNLQ